MQFFKARPQAATTNRLAAAAADRYIADNCNRAPLPYQAIASDDLTMEAAQDKMIDILPPG